MPEPDPLEGIQPPVTATLARVAMRMRGSNTTLSGWRMSVTSAGGDGSIDLVDCNDGGVLFRGGGIFLGWSQPRLAAARTRLLPPAPSAQPDSGQWG